MWRGITIFLLVALFIEPPPARAQEGLGLYEYTMPFSWLDWWETNRDTYLRKILKGRLEATTAPKEISAKVVDALLEATHSDSRDVRAESALALARIGKGDNRLLELTRDPDERVRCRAWVCLGLIQKENELLKGDKLGDAETVAVVVGLGLLDQPTAKAVDRVRLTARSAKYAEAQRMGIWALRVYYNLNLVNDKKVDNSLLLNLVRTSDNSAVVSEALLAMGIVGGRDDLPQLLDVAALGRQTLALPAFARLSAKAKLSAWPSLFMRAAACLAIAQMKDSEGKFEITTRGINRVAEAEAISARSAMLNKNAESEGTSGPPILALARLGDTDSLHRWLRLCPFQRSEFMTEAAWNKLLDDTTFMNDVPWLARPERADAAIGLAIYGGGDGVYGGIDWLQFFVSDSRTSQNLRAACAMAMALSSNGSSDLLAQAADKLNPSTDAWAYGYLVLALALRQDSRTLQYASRFGLGGRDAIDPVTILKSDWDLRIHCQAKY